MSKLPHWIKPAKGVNRGVARFSIEDDYGAGYLTQGQSSKALETQFRYVIAINLLTDFNTRIYGFDWGGMFIHDFEMDEFQYVEWDCHSSL